MNDNEPGNSLAQTREALGQDAQNLKQNVGQTVQHVKEHAQAHVDYVKNKTSDSFGLIRSYATNRPLVTVGTAFAVGYLTAVWRRR